MSASNLHPPESGRPAASRGGPPKRKLLGPGGYVFAVAVFSCLTAVAAGLVWQHRMNDSLRQDLGLLGIQFDGRGRPGKQPETPELDLIRSLQEDIKQLKARLDESTAAVNRSLEELSQSLDEKAIGQAADLNSLQPMIDSLNAARKELSQAENDRFDRLENEIGRIASELSGLRASLKQSEVQVDPAAARLDVPADEDLCDVVFLVDTGQQMAQHGYQSVYQALFEVVDRSIRQTLKRKIGMLSNRGDRISTLLTLDVHQAPDSDQLRNRLDQNRPTPGEDAQWIVGIQSAVDVLATRPGRWRVVYVTCNPLRNKETPPETWEEVIRQCRQFDAEVWVTQLLDKAELQQSVLVQLATQTGGQYAAVPSAPAAADPSTNGAATRLRWLWQLALDLPAGSASNQ